MARAGWTKFSKEQIKTIKRMYAEGTSDRAIAIAIKDTTKRVKSKIMHMRNQNLLSMRGSSPITHTHTTAVKQTIHRPLNEASNALYLIQVILELPQMLEATKLQIISTLIGGLHGQDRLVTQGAAVPHADRAGGNGTAGAHDAGTSGNAWTQTI